MNRFLRLPRNQYANCPRRCGLIYLEGEFTSNIHTACGNVEHAGARVEYALPVWSDRLGLVGKCDVVEFHSDGNVYPIEYKHGPHRRWINDDLQLCAQALCLEEMTGKPIAHAAIYHAASRRRREVAITDDLRRAVEEIVCNSRDACRRAVAAARQRQALRRVFVEGNLSA